MGKIQNEMATRITIDTIQAANSMKSLKQSIQANNTAWQAMSNTLASAGEHVTTVFQLRLMMVALERRVTSLTVGYLGTCLVIIKTLMDILLAGASLKTNLRMTSIMV